MEAKDEWVFFREIDWDCLNNNGFWIDTRDFHCGYGFREVAHDDYDTLKQYDHFFHTKDELLELIERYFTESGGKQKWRFFNLEGVENWNMKYIRIARTELGFIVCNSDWKALNKEFLSKKVEQSRFTKNPQQTNEGDI